MMLATKSVTSAPVASVAPRQAPRPQRVVATPQAMLGSASAGTALHGRHQQHKAAFTHSLVAPRRASRAQRAVAVRAEISYVMVKPDGVQRGLVGDIISRFERKGFKLVGLKLYQTPKEVAEEHYKDLKSKPFYPALVEYILSGPVVAMVWEGKGVVASARKLIGATNPLVSEPGTIRGDFAIEVGRNVIHGSDSVENGEREAALWFGKDSIVDWSQTMEPWIKEEGRD